MEALFGERAGLTSRREQVADSNSIRKAKDLSVGESKIQGIGVFSEKRFSKGDIVLEIDDSDPVPDRSKLTTEQIIHIDVFVGVDGSERVTFGKSPDKYINTSCDPNLYVKTDMATGIRSAYALKDIHVGEELTCDYAINSWEEWSIPIPCNCGSDNCRGIIRGNYFTLPREIQRKYLPLLDEPFKRKYAREIESLELLPDAKS